MGNLNQVVEDLMKEQHKDMLRRLKSGEFDARLGLEGIVDAPATPPFPQPLPPVAPAPAPPLPPVAPTTASPLTPFNQEPPGKKQNLDDLIFDFLSAGDDKH
jgi:hypothetical protein